MTDFFFFKWNTNFIEKNLHPSEKLGGILQVLMEILLLSFIFFLRKTHLSNFEQFCFEIKDLLNTKNIKFNQSFYFFFQ